MKGQGVEARLEDCDDEQWQIVDLGWCIVHFMTAESNERYRLHDLWTGKEDVDTFVETELKASQ